MPAGEAFVRCQRIVKEAIDDRRSEGLAMSLLARLCAMRGDFEHARSLYRSARATLEDLGRSVVAASTSLDSCGVEMLAGNPAAAESELSRDYAALSEMGETYLLSTVAAELARAVGAQGRLEEAARLTGEAEVLAADDDLTSQALWRSVRARVLAASGDHEHAIALAREAVSILQPTDAAVVQADALVDLAEVLRAAGEAGEAESTLRVALELNERKGNVVAAERVRQELGEPARAPLAL
jgi:tetratricopeptide (TPR) repeat protein